MCNRAKRPKSRLGLAEYYIKELGLWEHYQTFLGKSAKKPTRKRSVQQPNK